MKIMHKDLKKGIIKFKTENLDDLWYISNLIDKFDLVEGATYRKIKVSKDENSDVIKKKIYLKIEVEKIEFHKYSNSLRVSGKIIHGPDDISIGSYHTFNIDENTELTLTKDKWYNYQIKKLQEAANAVKSKILIVVFDREEAIFAKFNQTNYEIISSIKGNVSKKAMDAQHSNFYQELNKILEEYEKRENYDHIVLASPSFFSEYLLKEIKDETILKKTVKAACSSVTKSAINEVINRPELHTILSKQQATNEMKAVEKLLANISKDKLSAYGLKEVKKVSDYGAVDVLLITDNLISKKREDETFEVIEHIMKTVEKTNGTVNIINSDHAGGKKLDGLGGIGAILRYEV